MEPIEIVHSTPSKLLIRCGSKTATISGEALVRLPGQPDFIIYANSLKAWQHNINSVKILSKERDEVIKEVVRQLEIRGWRIEVE